MLSFTSTRAQIGIDAPAVTVETHIGPGLPRTTVVGASEKSVQESRDRVKCALQNSHFDYPDGRITISLAPTELPKQGGRFDLAIAIGILVASEQMPAQSARGFEFIGELALDGRIRPVRGALPAAIAATRAGNSLVVATDIAEEAAMASGATIIAADNLLQLCAHLKGETLLNPARPKSTSTDPEEPHSLGDIRGQAVARRALEIAAAGGHNLLMSGPPGIGKTMIASRMGSVLPPLDDTEWLETAAIYSVGTHCHREPASRARPFRAPHRTASAASIIGGGSNPRPGEISLAHNGVLFLDELPEWPRRTLELLREPIESRHIMISRALGHVRFPAHFQLIAAMNPCPCGFAGSERKPCRCTPDQINQYQQRISGPMLDRFDIQCVLEQPRVEDIFAEADDAEPDDHIRARVFMARSRQQARQRKLNAELEAGDLETRVRLSDTGKEIIGQLAGRHALSIRACHRIMRTARTIADLEENAEVRDEHLLEAAMYRLGNKGKQAF